MVWELLIFKIWTFDFPTILTSISRFLARDAICNNSHSQNLGSRKVKTIRVPACRHSPAGVWGDERNAGGRDMSGIISRSMRYATNAVWEGPWRYSRSENYGCLLRPDLIRWKLCHYLDKSQIILYIKGDQSPSHPAIPFANARSRLKTGSSILFRGLAVLGLV